MSPRLEREAAMDDMAEYAQTQAAKPPIMLALPALLAEVPSLAMRIAHSQTHARDVALVHQLAERLRAAHQPTNKEPLEGMLLIDIPDERDARAPALSFDRYQRVA